MKKIIMYLFLIFAPISCVKKQNIEVEYFGSLSSIIHEADISAKVSLTEIQNINNLYALGAVENLKGEIIIINGKPYISSVENNNIRIDSTFNYNASLLVLTSVKEWENYSIEELLNNKDELESFIVRTSINSEIDTAFVIPFLIKGEIKSAVWHLIDWIEGDVVHTHEKHKKSGMRGILRNEDVTILGFYSKKHKGIFTHKNSKLHMHILTNNKKISGHLDEIELENNTLLLPKNY